LNPAGVVAALAAEARTFAASPSGGGAPRPGEVLAGGGHGFATLNGGMLLAVSGVGQAAAAATARRLIEAGAGALVSWGLAGGLAPSLEAGVVCLPEEVIDPEGTRYPTTGEWREALAALVAAHRPVARGTLLTSAAPIATVAAKAAANRDTGAVAVDMESSAVAKAARAGGIPFIAVRAIVDTAADEVPRAVTGASESGQVRIGPLLAGLMRSPVELLALLPLAKRYRSAMSSLRAVAALLAGTSPTAADPALPRLASRPR
jgi:adenosylhomocysteine nucleosidase